MGVAKVGMYLIGYLSSEAVESRHLREEKPRRLFLKCLPEPSKNVESGLSGKFSDSGPLCY